MSIRRRAGAGRPVPEIIALNARAFEYNITITRMCQRAGIAPGSWTNLRFGAVPRLMTLHRLSEALDSLIAEQEAGQ